MKPYRWILVVMLLTAPAFGLTIWKYFPNDKPVQEEWPKAIVKAINSKPRVYGGGGREYAFYFKGATGDVNEFLQTMAKDATVPLTVTLVTEPGRAEVRKDLFDPTFKIEFNWSMSLIQKDYYAYIRRNEGETDAAYEKRREREIADAPAYTATVVIHCNGAIDLDKLELPLRFTANVGGKMGRLVKAHNARREDLIKTKRPIDGEKPTDMPTALGGGGVFGAGGEPTTQNIFDEPTTQPADGEKE